MLITDILALVDMICMVWSMEVKVRYYREKRECILAAVSHPSLALQRRADCSCAVRGELQSRPHCGQPDVLLSDAHSATVILTSIIVSFPSPFTSEKCLPC